MFKNNKSKEFCQQIDKKIFFFIKETERARKKLRKMHIFGILCLFRTKLLSNKEDPLSRSYKI